MCPGHNYSAPSKRAIVSAEGGTADQAGGRFALAAAAASIASGDTMLYGTTNRDGGPTGSGTVFQMMLDGGKWTETPIWRFADDGGESVNASGVVLGAGGALYGATRDGTNFPDGTVYKLLPPASGGWLLRTMHVFSGGADGSSPNPIIIGKGKVIYGTTQSGGGACNCGTLFKIQE